MKCQRINDKARLLDAKKRRRGVLGEPVKWRDGKLGFVISAAQLADPRVRQAAYRRAAPTRKDANG